MDTSNSGLMGLLLQKMAYLNQRQQVLAQNVANNDTPGFQARDLAPFTFNDAMSQTGMTMATTDPRHIIPASLAGINAKTIKPKSYDTVPTGNSVDIEQQMMEVSKTAVDYKEVSSIYHTIGSFFRIALKGS